MFENLAACLELDNDFVFGEALKAEPCQGNEGEGIAVWEELVDFIDQDVANVGPIRAACSNDGGSRGGKTERQRKPELHVPCNFALEGVGKPTAIRGVQDDERVGLFVLHD